METKLCKHCNTLRSIDSFGRNKGRIRPYCKICSAEIQRAYYKINRERCLSTHRKYWKGYYVAHKDALKERYRQFFQEHPEKPSEYGRRYYHRNKEQIKARRRIKLQIPEELHKIRARGAVNTAKKRGKLIAPTICTRCGKEAKIHAHHYDGYAEENYLTVEWLCIPCHLDSH